MTNSPSFTHRIFISHSSKDNAFGVQLAEDLRQVLGNDNAVWYDSSGGLHGGDIWWRKIVEEVIASNIFIVVLSPDAMASLWVNDEINLAWRRKNSPSRMRILPVLYQPCEIRPDLDTLQIISFLPPKSYEDAFRDLLIALGLPPNVEPQRTTPPSNDLGTIIFQQMEKAFAKQDWSTVLRKADYLIKRMPDTTSSAVYRLQGLTLFEKGEIRQAQEAFDTAIALASDDQQCLGLLSDCTSRFVSLGHWEDVLHYTTEALRIVPKDPNWLARQQQAQMMIQRSSPPPKTEEKPQDKAHDTSEEKPQDKANKRDYYEVLGVARNATDEEVKKSFRHLIKQYHPDANKEQGAEARFIEINEAYAVLSDPQKRAAYDRYGHAGLGKGVGAGSSGDFAGYSSINDLFETFFANSKDGQRQAGTQRGADLRSELTLTFEEAVFGCQKEIVLPRWETCSKCRGSGHNNTISCEKCQGQGRVHVNRRVVVNIPAGVDNGINVRVKGEGDVGASGGTPGNLYVVLTVKPHPFFKRQGNDIIYELPISFTQAALGDEVEVPTIDGKTTPLKIPAGTKSGQSFRLKGLGVPVVHSTARGDQHVIVKIVEPTNMTPEQMRLLEEFAHLEQEQAGQKDKNFFRNIFDKTKDAFQ